MEDRPRRAAALCRVEPCDRQVAGALYQRRKQTSLVSQHALQRALRVDGRRNILGATARLESKIYAELRSAGMLRLRLLRNTRCSLLRIASVAEVLARHRQAGTARVCRHRS